MEPQYEYLSRIKEHYNLFSESEKSIADYLMHINGRTKLPRDISEMTVNQLAKATKTSSATIIRFCKTLGFKGLTEMKYYIQKGLLSSSQRELSINVNDPVSAVRQKISNFNKNAIEDTNALLNDEALKLSIKKILKAKELLILGEGGSGCSARAAQIEFMQIGLNCSYYGDSYTQMLASGQLDKRCVILAISHSGRASNTIDACKYAKELGVFIIGITSIHNSALTKCSDAVLYISSMEMDFFSNTAAARICELNTLSILHSGISQALSDKIPLHHDLVDKLYETKRVPVSRKE